MGERLTVDLVGRLHALDNTAVIRPDSEEIAFIHGPEAIRRGFASSMDVQGVVDGTAPYVHLGRMNDDLLVVAFVQCYDFCAAQDILSNKLDGLTGTDARRYGQCRQRGIQLDDRMSRYDELDFAGMYALEPARRFCVSWMVGYEGR